MDLIRSTPSLYPIVRLMLSRNLFSLNFPTKGLYGFLNCRIYATHPVHLTFLGLIPLTVFCEEHKLSRTS